MKKLLPVFMCFSLLSFASAQEWSAEKLLSDTDKYLGKKVNLFICHVIVPAINATDDVNYRDFTVFTAKQNMGGFDVGGYITVRVSRKEASSFTQKYGTSTRERFVTTADCKHAKVFTGMFVSDNGEFLVDATAVPKETPMKW